MDFEEIARRLGYANAHKLMRGEITGVTPKKKRQKGFKGFASDAPKYTTLTQECVMVNPTTIKLLDLKNVRMQDGYPTAECRYNGRVVQVRKELVQDPHMNENVIFRGIGRVWRIVDG